MSDLAAPQSVSATHLLCITGASDIARSCPEPLKGVVKSVVSLIAGKPVDDQERFLRACIQKLEVMHVQTKRLFGEGADPSGSRSDGTGNGMDKAVAAAAPRGCSYSLSDADIQAIREHAAVDTMDVESPSRYDWVLNCRKLIAAFGEQEITSPGTLDSDTESAPSLASSSTSQVPSTSSGRGGLKRMRSSLALDD